MIFAKIRSSEDLEGTSEQDKAQVLIQAALSTHVKLLISKIDELVNKGQVGEELFSLLVTTTLLKEAAEVALWNGADEDDFGEMASDLFEILLLSTTEASGNA